MTVLYCAVIPCVRFPGVTHGGVMSPPTTWQTSLVLPFITTASCMGSKFCRNFARSQDVM